MTIADRSARPIHYVASLGGVVALGLGLLLGGCAHKQKNNAMPETAAASPAAGGTTATPSTKNSCTTDTDCGDGRLCLNQVCVDINEHLDACGMQRVHFSLDSSEIAEQDRPLLERAARCLRAAKGIKFTIEGNADERGTEEYNVALGDRRAQSVARYLEKLGATADQLKTVSYGKENPICQEHDEACWQKNRRAAVKPPGK
ncbi:MAG: peptidoglycan-associated lipoprotein Pal [Polyangia bacterium]